jgi:thiopurine S-methyltransferase
MEPERWLKAWDEDNTRFHKDGVHADLLAFGEAWAQGADRVLVPLCGKTLDLGWLAERSREVVGIELAEKAIRAANGEQGFEMVRQEGAPFIRWEGPRVTMLQGDLFDASAEHLGRFDRIWDRAAMVALAPSTRARYVDLLRDMLAPGGTILLNVFTYDQSKMDGPPFSIPRSVVEEFYEGATIEVLKEEDVKDTIKVAEIEWDRFLMTTYRISGASR